MYHSTPYFTISQTGVNFVEINDPGRRSIQLRPQDAIELANEIIRQGVIVPKPDKPGKEIDLKEVGQLDLEKHHKNVDQYRKNKPPPA
jgi:hypothetical protein